jgi:hypothetical protein
MSDQPAPAPEPILYFENQPISREAAAQTRAGLMADPEFSKKALAGDKEAQQKLTALWQLERGIQPPPPATTADVEKQMVDRLEIDRAAHASALHSSAEFTPEQVHQITNGRPIPLAEQKMAQQRLAVLQKDKAFVMRYLDGDRQAGLEMRLATIAARGLPVAKDLAEIEAWNKAHPFRR